VAVLERHAVKIDADRDSAHDSRIEHADETHQCPLDHYPLINIPRSISSNHCPPLTNSPADASASASSSSIRDASERLMYCKCKVGPVSTSSPRLSTL